MAAEPHFSEQGVRAGLGAAVFVPLADSFPGMASGGAVADFDRDGTFSEVTAASGTGLDANGMGNAVGDFDGDGRLD